MTSRFQARLQSLLPGVTQAFACTTEQLPVDATFLLPLLAASEDGGVAATSAESHVLLEIALRMVLHGRLGADSLERPDFAAFIRSILAVAVDISVVRRVGDATLPLLLLEDAFDALPISQCEPIWDVLESHKDRLAAAINAAQKYRMPLLRIASSLTHRLSRSQHTVFLGRILITLAYMFPLSDRSGVNLHGHFDADNATLYEGKDADTALFAEVAKVSPPVAAAASAGAPKAAAAAPQAAGRGGRSAPDTPSSSAAAAAPTALSPPPPLSSPNTDPASRDVLPLLPVNAAAAAHLQEAAAAVAAGKAATSPAFLRTFWRAQSYMVAPARATATPDAWMLFVCTIRLVLRAFEVGRESGSMALAGSPTAAAVAGTVGIGSSSGAHPVAGGVPRVQSSSTLGQALGGASSSSAGARGGAVVSVAANSDSSAREEGEEEGAAATGQGGGKPSPLDTSATAGAAARLLSHLSSGSEIESGASTAHAGAASSSSPAEALLGMLVEEESPAAGPSPPPSSSSAAASTSAGAAAPFHGVKYLTNARLLALELRDVALARHVCTQILILLQYLEWQRTENEAFAAGTAGLAAGAAAVAAPGPASGTAGASSSPLAKSRPAAPAGSASPSVPAAPSSGTPSSAAPAPPRKPRESFSPLLLAAPSPLAADIYRLVAGAYGLLSRTSPEGIVFARCVRAVLEREVFWRSWKTAGAPPYEKEPGSGEAAAAGTDGEAAATAVGAKRKAESSISGGGMSGAGLRPLKKGKLGGGQGAAGPRSLAWASVGLERDLLNDVCADVSRTARPRLADMLAPMVEALDPENGIEAEYWPSTNKAYVWRAYRLISAEKLKAMHDVASENDFVDVICKIQGVKRPSKTLEAAAGTAQPAGASSASAVAASPTAASAAAAVGGDTPSVHVQMASSPTAVAGLTSPTFPGNNATREDGAVRAEGGAFKATDMSGSSSGVVVEVPAAAGEQSSPSTGGGGDVEAVAARAAE